MGSRTFKVYGVKNSRTARTTKFPRGKVLDPIKGSTITMLIDTLDGNFILLWVGDSPAFLYTPESPESSDLQNNIRKLIIPHSTENPAEIERIEASGAMIIEIQGQKRVNGELGITRALGNSGGPTTIPKPDAKLIPKTPNSIILLCSDGIQGEKVSVILATKLSPIFYTPHQFFVDNKMFRCPYRR